MRTHCKKQHRENGPARRHLQKESCGGFTIVEVLIALTIFSIAVAGVITVAVQGGINVEAAKNKLVANYLTDEGIELMRAMRDTYITAVPVGSEDPAWAAYVATATTACTASAPCDIDATNASGSMAFPSSLNFTTCLSGGCVINYDGATGYYTDQAGVGKPTVFKRSIVVSTYSGVTDEVQVTSTVTWNQGSAPQSITETENMFNWY